MPKIVHPYRGLTNGEWLRGNLHTHTTNSDGSNRPQHVINDYARRGYDFLAISDHDIYTSPKDYKQWNDKGMILLPGNEVSANGPHILHVGADRFVEPVARRQELINSIASGKGLAVIAHPNWLNAFDGTPITQLQEWVGYHGLEIYNGLIGRLPGSPYCTNKWDILLSQGRRLWGFAHDDSHADQDVGRGWDMVYAKKRTAGGILEALAAGSFYASSGVTISSIKVRGMQITIETENASRIVAVGNYGVRQACVDDSRIQFDVPEGLKYVRFECWGDGEKFAWTQPFFIK
ncbi:MAG: CehA/McbA family metallohydrolase [Planctomycetota bacterium]|nr:CehA/McbA family metallohydrolase [Planctomycetota bacterium]